MVCDEGVGHSGHGDKGKERGRDAANAVTKVEQADGETAENDGEVEPGEEGTLVGEEDLGLDAGGQRNAFACLFFFQLVGFGGGIAGEKDRKERTRSSLK